MAKYGTTAVVTIDRPPVNALSAPVRRGLLDAFNALADDSSVAGIVLACAGRTFVAGAEISEFGTDAFDEADPNDVHAVIESLDKPVVCALHGTTLGGGMELALACHYRVAAPTARLGLPEVTLGLLPGGGEKVAVVSGVCFGFIGNRMLEPYLREAEFLLLEGATPVQIDRAIEAFGMAMGPCRMIDMAGLDVAANQVAERCKEGKLPADPKLLSDLAAAERPFGET